MNRHSCPPTGGVVPETELGSEAEPHLTPISGLEFVKHWIAARHALDSASGATQQ